MWRGAYYSNCYYKFLVLKKYTIEYLCLYIKIKCAVKSCAFDFFYTQKGQHCRSPPQSICSKKIDWRKGNMQYEVDSYKLEYIEETEKYFICFKDSAGKDCRIEIQKEIFDTYMQSRKEYKKIQNQYDRHEEQSEQTEISLYKKAIISKFNVEDIVIQKITSTALRKAVREISAPHNRRLEMYFFKEMTVKEISIKENKTERTIRYSISKGIDEIAKKIEKI